MYFLGALASSQRIYPSRANLWDLRDRDEDLRNISNVCSRVRARVISIVLSSIGSTKLLQHERREY